MKPRNAVYGDEAIDTDDDDPINDHRHDEEHENEFLLLLEDTAGFVDWLRTSRDDDAMYDLLVSDQAHDVLRARNILRDAYLNDVTKR